MINRLDRLVSGIVMLALNPETAASMHNAMSNNDWVKEYICVVDGVFPDGYLHLHDFAVRLPAISRSKQSATSSACSAYQKPENPQRPSSANSAIMKTPALFIAGPLPDAHTSCACICRA